jgi:hypothetical protein
MSDTSTNGNVKASYAGTVQSIPPTTKGGFWKDQSEVWKSGQPGDIHVYNDVSPTQASNLKDVYGVEAFTRNSRKVANPATGGETERCTLYVRWPGAEQADANRAASQKRKAENKAKREAAEAKAAEAKGKGQTATVRK